MTKYLQTKTNSIEEAISSVVLGEAKFQVNYSKGGKLFSKTINAKDEDDAEDKAIKKFKIDDDDIRSVVKEELNEKIRTPQKLQRKMQLKKQTNFDFRLFDPEDSPGSDKANDDMNKEIVKASKMKDKDTAFQHMMRVSKKHSKHGATDTEPREMIQAILNRVFGESVELGEGYESEVLKVLRDADIDGYFKMGKLYVSRRDAKDAKKALDDSDEITKLPKMVMEDDRMKKLTPRQRQALARVQAKPKSQVSLPKMPDFMKPKKEENEMDIVDTIKGIVEKKLDPVNKDAVKKKFDDRKDKDIDNDGDVDSTDKYLHKRRKAISKAISKEAYDIGKDYAQHTLDVTPGQDKKDVDKMLNTAYTKNQSMRESLAKVWGLDEGKSPFQKEEEKPLTKTMTGQKPTTVKVNPKIEEK